MRILSSICIFVSLLSCNKKAVLAPAISSKSSLSEITMAKTPGSLGIKGNGKDTVTTTSPGFVLMGGGADVDEAITWMLQRSGGGDIVVIRSTGTNAYNSYMYSLAPVNSVETLLINSTDLANNQQVANRIRQAEGLFIAGGDQWEYVSFWKGTLVNNAINYLINVKKVPVGGTSAGCMILGQVCFDAQNTSITSQQVLNNPYNNGVTFTRDFINIPVLAQTITDTHYDNPDRRGRQFGFMARMFTDWNYNAKGIGVQESTAVAIDENNKAKVFGSGKAFFLKTDTAKGKPEQCNPGKKLTWNKNQQAVNAYVITGSTTGRGNVNLNTWNSFSGGIAQWFSSNQGVLTVKNQ